MDHELRAMLCHTAYIAPPLAVSELTDIEHGEPIPVRVYQQSRSNVVHSPDGSELMSDVTWVTEHQIGLHDLCWLVGCNPDDRRLSRRPKSVAPVYDERGRMSHYEVAL